MGRGRHDLNDYDDSDLPWYLALLLKGAGVAMLCGLVWVLVTYVK